MIGAFLGDLAAWTWKNDYEQVYSKLISEKAKKSIYGNVLELTAETLVRNPHILPEEFKKQQGVFFNYHKAKYPTIAKYAVIRAVVVGWIYDTLEETEEAVNSYCLCEEKEEWYASHFLATLIFLLRHGATKKEAMMDTEHLGGFEYFVNNQHCQEGDGVLSKLVRVWKAFCNAYDYGSCIHKAGRLPGSTTFNCIIAGALADAMYGCDYYFVKQKYNGGYDELTSHIDIDEVIFRVYKKNRIFFPKNNAMTNVEKHNWVDVPNSIKDKVITRELRRRILKAFHTSHDYKFGLYLDDGWIYLYRSFHLLNRFILSKQEDDTYRITHFQATDLKHSSTEPLSEALYVLEYKWYCVCDEKEKKDLYLNIDSSEKGNELLKHCRYYQSEDENPYIMFTHHPQWQIWKLEKEWLETTSCNIISGVVSYYTLYDIKNFEANDGVPYSLKAYLFYQFMKWTNEQYQPEKFKRFYYQWRNRELI